MKITTSQSKLLLAAILILAAIVRFQSIDQPFVDQYSWREASTAMMADNFFRRNWNIFYPEISWNGPEPSYNGREFQTVSYIAALLYTILGQQDWIARSVAVVFGLWGIFALYKLTCRVWTQNHGLMAAAVMALLPGSIFIEREFLPDPAMVALVTTGCWMLVAYCQTEKLHYLGTAIIISAWGFLTKLTSIVVGIPMAYAIFTILNQRKLLNSKKLLIIGISAVLTLVPVIAYYLWARYLYLNYPPHHFAGAGSWLWDKGLKVWIDEKYYLSKLYQLFKGWIWTKPVMVLVCLGLVLRPPQYRLLINSSQPSEASFAKAPWFFHWWIVGVLFYYLIGCKHLIDQPYNFHLINPAAAALSGHAILTIASLIQQKFRFSAALASVLVVFFVIGQFGYRQLKPLYYPFTEPSYQLGLQLRDRSKANDLVLSIADEIGNPIMIYYSQRRGWIFPPSWSKIPWWDDLTEGQDQQLIAELNELRNKGTDWLGIANLQYTKLQASNPKFTEHLDRNYTLKDRNNYTLKDRNTSGMIYQIAQETLPSP